MRYKVFELKGTNFILIKVFKFIYRNRKIINIVLKCYISKGVKVLLKSITEKERIIEIDIIRGIAILGIFFVNFPEMVMQPLQQVSYSGLDGFIRLIYNLLIQTKFYTIFSFLFGLGFYIFMSRAEVRGDKMYKLFFRRLFFLFVFGFVHFILLWHGDILNMYALVGIWLLLFYNKRPKTILVWAIILLSIAIIFNGMIYLGPTVSEILEETLIHSELQQYNPLIDIPHKIGYRFNLFKDYSISGAISYTPEILSLFLFGLYAGKIKFFNRLEEFSFYLKKSQLISFILSLICFIPMVNLYFNSSTYQLQSGYFFVWLSGKTMAIFYISTILRLLRQDKWQKILKPFSYVGKMALTNYIGQTVITTVIFSILFKNTAIIPLWASLLYCPLIYICQIRLSKWWLSKHKMGPLEQVWRYATYYTNKRNQG